MLYRHLLSATPCHDKKVFMNKLLSLLFTLQCICAFAAPQTVDDSACAHYGADIASFATCEGDRVVKPGPEIKSKPVVKATVKNKTKPVPAKTNSVLARQDK